MGSIHTETIAMTAPTDTPADHRLDLTDFVPFPDFCRQAEKLNLATRTQLQWWMRYRHQNGLIGSGAIVEKAVNPKSSRKMLFVVRPRFIDWLASGRAAG